jgi:hypothetical protein
MNDFYHAALTSAWAELLRTAGWLLIVAGISIALFCWMIALISPTHLYLAKRLRKAKDAGRLQLPETGRSGRILS